MYGDIQLYKEEDSLASVPFKGIWSRRIAENLNSISKNLNSDGLGFMMQSGETITSESFSTRQFPLHV